MVRRFFELVSFPFQMNWKGWKMLKVKIGQKVICVDNSDFRRNLSVGTVYTIERAKVSIFSDKLKFSLSGIDGYSFYSHRFISWPDEIDRGQK